MNAQTWSSRLSCDAHSRADDALFFIRAAATLDNAAQAVDALHPWLDARSLGSRVGFHAALIVDELLHNVAMHGLPGAPPQSPSAQRTSDPAASDLAHTTLEFALWVAPCAHGLHIALHDNGRRFDALAARPSNRRAPSLDDPAGGLGLTLLHQLIHAAHYQYCRGENQLFILVPVLRSASSSRHAWAPTNDC